MEEHTKIIRIKCSIGRLVLKLVFFLRIAIGMKNIRPNRQRKKTMTSEGVSGSSVFAKDIAVLKANAQSSINMAPTNLGGMKRVNASALDSFILFGQSSYDPALHIVTYRMIATFFSSVGL